MRVEIKLDERSKRVSSNLHGRNRDGTCARCISDEIEGNECRLVLAYGSCGSINSKVARVCIYTFLRGQVKREKSIRSGGKNVLANLRDYAEEKPFRQLKNKFRNYTREKRQENNLLILGYSNRK